MGFEPNFLIYSIAHQLRILLAHQLLHFSLAARLISLIGGSGLWNFWLLHKYPGCGPGAEWSNFSPRVDHIGFGWLPWCAFIISSSSWSTNDLPLWLLVYVLQCTTLASPCLLWSWLCTPICYTVNKTFKSTWGFFAFELTIFNDVSRLQNLWNVTPKVVMLGQLPQGYTLETALADHVVSLY